MLISPLVQRIRGLFNRVGIDVVRYPSLFQRRVKTLLDLHQIDLVLDIGANRGQYGQFLRQLGYCGQIVSFEPLQSAFHLLQQAAAQDPAWSVHNLAVGDAKGTLQMNVAANSWSSSLLDMTALHAQAAKGSDYIAKQETPVETLDDLWATLVPGGSRVLLKMDVQGYEASVLAGGAQVLPKVSGIQLEMSFSALYKGEVLFEEMHQLLKAHGFEMRYLEPGFFSPEQGQLLQADGLYFREGALL